jgi:NDP-sugar pyrophosphorylase family protein
MTIIIPMAGLSQRFIDAGFTLPKYMLYVGNRSLFNLSISSFCNYFNTCHFLIVAKDVFETERFIESECKLLGIRNKEIVILNENTKGQAETVYLGLCQSKRINDQEPITIFNIDTFRSDFIFPEDIADFDGYLEVFHGEGSNWSFARTENDLSTKVIETAEKEQISKFCSTGLYYFRSVSLFKAAYDARLMIDQMNGTSELYVAPLYNLLIKNNKNIHINLIKRAEVQFCGIPDEYFKCLEQLFIVRNDL